MTCLPIEDAIKKAEHELFFELNYIERKLRDIVRLYAVWRYQKNYIHNMKLTKRDYIREFNKDTEEIEKALKSIKKKIRKT